MAAPASAGRSPEDIGKRILDRVNGFGRMISEIHAQTLGLASAAETRAVAIVIAALCRAGAEGVDTAQVKVLLVSAGFKRHQVDYVRETLVQAGVALCDGKHWFAQDISPAK